MTEQGLPPGGSPCPWCSAELPAEPEETCPWCGATLRGDAEAPGLTSVDPASVRDAVRAGTPQRRSRLLSWITGDVPDDPEAAPAPPGSLAPPPPEVRREMLRLELEAEVAHLQAEVGALAADAREQGSDEDREVLEGVAEEVAELRADVAVEAPQPVDATQPDGAPEPLEPATSVDAPADPADAAAESGEAPRA